MRTSLLVTSLYLAIVHHLCHAQDDSCMRFDGKSGYCVHRNQCPKINDMFKRRKSGIPYTADEIIYIQNSGCSVKKGFVCCEDEEKVAEGIEMLRDQDCGKFSTPKTIGGKEVDLMSRPWMVYLTITNTAGTRFMCGGTLISNRYVLTSAHCFKNRTLHSVRLGEHNLATDLDCKHSRGKLICAPQVINMQNNQVFQHEEYSPITKLNDIALVKLSADVTFSTSVKPICLPLNETLQELTKTIANFSVAGWGATGSTQTSNVLRETIVSNMNKSRCDRAYIGIPLLASSQLCAGDVGRDSCNGDSGGPLTYVSNLYNGQQRFIQFGITSFGSPKCGDGNPGVYTNVASYIRWIAYKIATK